MVFATVALGMGMDIRSMRRVVRITSPYIIQAYFQKSGRAERDGQRATAVIFYKNGDAAKNKPEMQETVRDYRSKSECLANFLLTLLHGDKKYFKPESPKHLCCNICKLAHTYAHKISTTVTRSSNMKGSGSNQSEDCRSRNFLRRKSSDVSVFALEARQYSTIHIFVFSPIKFTSVEIIYMNMQPPNLEHLRVFKSIL